MNKLINSFQHAGEGFLHALRTEANLRFHFATAVIVCSAGYWLQLSAMEWIAVVGCISAVVGFELMNTAVEQLCNMVTKETHPGIKAIKDISAAAVLLVCTGAAVIGTIIFLPKLINQFSS